MCVCSGGGVRDGRLGVRSVGTGKEEAGDVLRETRACMHHKVVGNFGREADVRSLYYRRFRFNETSDVGACTHGRPAK